MMDFLSQDEDDEGEEDANPGDGDGEDDEAASPTFQRSIANIRSKALPHFILKSILSVHP